MTTNFLWGIFGGVLVAIVANLLVSKFLGRERHRQIRSWILAGVVGTITQYLVWPYTPWFAAFGCGIGTLYLILVLRAKRVL